MIWVTPDQILTAAGARIPASAADTEWAAACAAAVNEGFDFRLTGALYAGTPAELTWAARSAGVEAYKRREATFGLTGFVDLQGAAIRVARDYIEAQAPIIARYATFGLA